MTIKELYELAVEFGYENASVVINYECNDSWYDYYETVKEKEVDFDEYHIIINPGRF
jgi:hypothetical protein